MRILISGGGDVGRATAETLVNAGHEVVLVEEDRAACERLAGDLDIMVICGDATRPDILEKGGIEDADIVLALSGNDRMNIITALVAKEYGVKRVIVKLDDPTYNIVCQKLGVEEVVNPKIAAAKHIADMVRQPHAIELSTLVGGSIRVFTAIVRKDGYAGKKIEDIELPEGARVMVVQRGSEFFIPARGFRVKEGDHLSILCLEKNLEELARIFG